MTALTWEHGAQLCMAAIEDETYLYNQTIDIEHEIVTCHDRLVEIVFADGFDDRTFNPTLHDTWKRFGAIGWMGCLRNGTYNLAGATDVLISKQRDYGPRNIARFGNHGLVIRAFDKVARYQNLIKVPGQALNEPLTDTLLDFVGYACVAMMWNRPSPTAEREFLLPMRG